MKRPKGEDGAGTGEEKKKSSAYTTTARNRWQTTSATHGPPYKRTDDGHWASAGLVSRRLRGLLLFMHADTLRRKQGEWPGASLNANHKNLSIFSAV